MHAASSAEDARAYVPSPAQCVGFMCVVSPRKLVILERSGNGREEGLLGSTTRVSPRSGPLDSRGAVHPERPRSRSSYSGRVWGPELGASSGSWFLVDVSLGLQVPYLLCAPPSSVELSAPAFQCGKRVAPGPPDG